MMTEQAKPYAVNEWGTHPDNGDDTCWTGDEFATLEEAEAVYAKMTRDKYTCFVELDGPDVHRVRQVREPKKVQDDADWRREIAVQNGMAFGCEAYNDDMGY